MGGGVEVVPRSLTEDYRAHRVNRSEEWERWLYGARDLFSHAGVSARHALQNAFQYPVA